ncbi:glycoside hydrolase family 2 [Planctomycetota bacterium]|nr:glycoside hydrolase family 2 [Planctomycetota bacterium]
MKDPRAFRVPTIGRNMSTSTVSTSEAAIVFAPQEGLVKLPEQPYRREMCLNGRWQFQSVALPEGWVARQGIAPELCEVDQGGWESTQIKIPSPWNVNVFAKSDGPDNRTYPSYPAEWEEVEMAWMQREFVVPEDWAGQKLFVHFEAVCGFAEVYVNDQKVGEHFDLFLPFDCDVTEQIKVGETNTLRVGVRSPRMFEDATSCGHRPFPGGSMWAQEIAGIWQDVYLHAFSPVRVSDVFVKPLVSKGQLELEIEVTNDTDKQVNVTIDGLVKAWLNLADDSRETGAAPNWALGDDALSFDQASVSVEANATVSITVETAVKDELLFWTPDTPNLYALLLDVQIDDKLADRKYERFGWREWTIEGNKHLLNGKPYELKGDSWHCLGVTQMTRRYPWAWYTAIKEANGNAARPHAQIYPRFFMEVADEMGIAILSETANWASDGGPKFDTEVYWERSAEHLRGLVKRDRNHASVYGWSTCNENRPVIVHVMRQADLLPRQIKEWYRWAEIVRELDPTRPWITGDGEEDGEGAFSATVGHYGDDNMMSKWADCGKPWGIGEHSMAYYGTPSQVSKFNGLRAYESMQGRMEGLAVEVYDLIRMQRKRDASYVSVFNLAWYSLQPLPLGMDDTSHAPTLEDGVHFADYVENKPGYQPERLGPYSATLNPGYDPNLPLFKPWPMWEAIRDANADGGPAESQWKNAPEPAALPEYPDVEMKPVEVLSNGESSLNSELNMLGITPVEVGMGHHLIIDGQSTPETNLAAARVRIILEEGGTVFVWSPIPEALDTINKILPTPMELTNREATSFLTHESSSTLGQLTHADVYFCEVQKDSAMKHGIAGDFAERGKVLISACNTDWPRWNKVSETIKASSVLRSEHEAKESGHVLVELESGKGKIVACSLCNITSTEQGTSVLRTIFTNIGIKSDQSKILAEGSAFDTNGRLRRAIVAGGFGGATMRAASQGEWVPETSIRPVDKMPAGEHTWFKSKTDQLGVFDFNTMGMKGKDDFPVAYVSFWIWSPRPLDDLLAEPDMPQLDLMLSVDNSYMLWLNGEKISEEIREARPVRGEFCIEALQLKTGWNHFLVKVIESHDEWGLSASLKTSDQAFLDKLKSSLEGPQES